VTDKAESLIVKSVFGFVCCCSRCKSCVQM